MKNFQPARRTDYVAVLWRLWITDNENMNNNALLSLKWQVLSSSESQVPLMTWLRGGDERGERETAALHLSWNKNAPLISGFVASARSTLMWNDFVVPEHYPASPQPSVAPANTQALIINPLKGPVRQQCSHYQMTCHYFPLLVAAASSGGSSRVHRNKHPICLGRLLRECILHGEQRMRRGWCCILAGCEWVLNERNTYLFQILNKMSTHYRVHQRNAARRNTLSKLVFLTFRWKTALTRLEMELFFPKR